MPSHMEIKQEQTLSREKYTLQKITFEYKDSEGHPREKTNEVYNIGNAVTALLFNPSKETVILTRQLRLVAFLYHIGDGMLIEACAGKLEKESPEEGIKREIEEETGYKVQAVRKVAEAFTSPGAIAELMYFYIAEYNESTKKGKGGGLESEQEDIEVLELPLEQAMEMITSGTIRDAKTIILLQHLCLEQHTHKHKRSGL